VLCPERYDVDYAAAPVATCNRCAPRTLNESVYPNDCYFGVHVIGNWSLPYCDDPRAKEQGYLDALASDLEAKLTLHLMAMGTADVTQLATPTAASPSQPLAYACPFPLPLNQSWAAVPAGVAQRVLPTDSNPASLRIGAVTINKMTVARVGQNDLPVFEGQFKRVALFDILLRGSSAYAVATAAACLASALSTEQGALGTAVTVSSGQLEVTRKAPAMPDAWTLPNVAAFLGADASVACLTGSGGFVANTSNFTACFPLGCGAPFDDSALAGPAAAASDFPYWIIGAAVGALLLIALTALVVLRFGLPKVGQKVLPARWFVDGTKYTVNFTHMEEMDEELRFMTAEREIDFDDI
jgi:hypothetical protein